MKPLQIGWARRDLSTTDPVLLLGQSYLRISQGIHDPILSNCLVLDGDPDSLIFLSVDAVAVGASTTEAVQAKVRRLNPAVPAQSIVMNCTHTHSGPPLRATEFTTGDKPEDEMPVLLEVADTQAYFEWATDRMAEAVCEAWENRAPGGIAFGYGYAAVGNSRRVRYRKSPERKSAKPSETYHLNGLAEMYGKTDRPEFDRYEAGTETFANFLYTFDAEKKLTGMLACIPCPSQCSENVSVLTASFWHEVRMLLAEKYGDIYLLPSCAPAGDLAPRVLHYKEAQKRRFALKFGGEETIKDEYNRRDIAERIFGALEEVLSWAKNDIRTEIKLLHGVRDIELSRWKITPEEYDAAKAGLQACREEGYVDTGDKAADFKENSRSLSNRKRFLSIIKAFEDQEARPKLPMELHTVRVGDIAFAFNPFELYMDYGHQIAARSPFIQTFLIQLAGQPQRCKSASGYLCTEQGREGKGYSAILYSCHISPEGGRELVEETLQALQEIAD